MNAQKAIDTAYGANAVEFANVEATRVFRNELDCTVRIPYILSSSQEKEVRDACPFPVLFSREQPYTGDHGVIASYRSVVRQIVKQQSDVRTTAVKSLVVGASAREYFSYGENKNVHFHFAMKDAKDQVRTVEQLLNETLRRIKKNASPEDKRLFYSDTDIKDLNPNSRVVKFRNARSLLAKLAKVNGDEIRVIFGDVVRDKSVGNYSHLYFEDVGYNFSEADWCNVFLNTGAISGDGYMFLPLELKFPNIPKDKYYNYQVDGKFSSVTYRFGDSNGYNHRTANWRTFLDKAVLSNGHISLAVELTARIGPMCSFKITRAAGAETIVRNICVPNTLRYVRVLDLFHYTLDEGRTKKYHSVRETEFKEALSYAMTLAEKSLTVENIATYVRRMRSGVSMANAEFLKPWSVDADDVHNLCLVVLVYSFHLRSGAESQVKKGADAMKAIARWRKLCQTLVGGLTVVATLGLSLVISDIYHWLVQHEVINELVVCDDLELFQRFSVSASDKPLKLDVMTHESEAGLSDTTCPICSTLEGRLGKQVLGCDHIADSRHLFDISTADLRQLKKNMDDTIESGPSGLASFFKKVRNHIPSVGFKHGVNIENFHGGPGTGKSFIARELCDAETVIVGPFKKLAADYEVVQENGETKKYPYFTMHKALEVRNKSNLFFDEWTAIDYTLMGVLAKGMNAKNVFLFGDKNQTGLQASEGRPPLTVFDLPNISTHRLLVNFRNTQYTVALLNVIYGYGMRANSEVLGLPEFYESDEENIDIGDSTPMTYSTASASQLMTDGEVDGGFPTVRRFQGTTVESTALFFTDGDHTLISNSQLFCVAMSRDRHGIKFYTDSGEALALMRAKCRVDDEQFIQQIPVLAKPDIVVNSKKPIGIDTSFIDEWRAEETEHCKVVPIVRDALVTTSGVVANGVVRGAAAVSTGAKAVAKNVALTLGPAPEPRRADPDEGLDAPLLRYTEASVRGEFRGLPLNDTPDDGNKFAQTYGDDTDERRQRLLVDDIAEAVESELFISPVTPRFPLPGGKSLDIIRDELYESAKADWVEGASRPNRWELGVPPLSVADDYCDVNGKKILVFKGWCTLAALLSQVPSSRLTEFKRFVLQHQEERNGVKFSTLLAFMKKEGIEFLAVVGGGDGRVIYCDVRPKVYLRYNNDMSHVTPLEFPSFNRYYRIECSGKCKSFKSHTRYVSGNELLKDIDFKHHVPVSGRRWVDQNSRKGGMLHVDLICSRPAGALTVAEQTIFDLGNLEAEDKVVKYSGFNRFDKVVLEQGVEETRLINRETRASFDSYLLGDILLPNPGTHYVTASFNEPWANNGMYELARNGTISIDFFSPVNQRGHPKALTTVGYVASQGYGNRYLTSNSWQSLQSLAQRYVRQKKKFRFCNQAKNLAAKVAALAVRELFDTDKLRSEFDVMECSHISNEFRRAAISRHYVSKFEGEAFTSPRTVRYHLKDIFKPVKDGKVDPTKVGQGISAWSSSANLDFGAAMRIISQKFRSSLKANVLFNNGYTDFEFATLLNSNFAALPASAVTGVVDGKEFDSMQNKFTQEIERCILSHVGVSDEFLLDYYSYRNDYTLLAANQFSAKPDSEKTSGEPGTLLLNSILEMVLTNAVLRGVGPFVMAVQGDDALKSQTKLKADEEMLNEISLYSDFKLKVEIGKDVEFCGDVVAGGVMLPCLYRTVQKIHGNVFRDIKHFQEYQVSLRDKVAYVETLGCNDVIAANCRLYNVNRETVECMYDVIKSFSHLDESQFSTVFKRVEFNHSGPSL